MRYIVYILLFCIGLSAFPLKSLQSKIEILKNRKKYEFKDINVTYDPFFKAAKIISLKKKISNGIIKPIKVRFILLTVLNHKAFINNQWYKKGEKIYGFKIVKIYSDKVILQKRKKKVILKIRQKRKILNIVEKRK